MLPLIRFRVGDLIITRLPEQVLEVADVDTMFPYDDATELRRDVTRWGDEVYDIQRKRLRQSIHSWLVQTPSLTVLIDTGLGNDKDRPGSPLFDHLHTPYMAYLDAAGVAASDIDIVFITHLHVDHVGWNTQLSDGRWRPTFPHARYVFSQREFEYSAALSAGDSARVRQLISERGQGEPHHFPLGGIVEDSLQPVVDAGLVDFITVGDSVEGFTFHASPGHSIDHASIAITSHGQTALFWGDVMHHPIQVRHPHVNSRYCEFLPAAIASRERMMAYALQHEAMVFTSHFGGSGAGRLQRTDRGIEWQFALPN